MATDTIVKKCMVCKEIKKIRVSQSALEKYKAGANVKDAFPSMSADDRELLISGVCGTCFDKMFEEPEPEHSCEEYPEEICVTCLHDNTEKGVE